MDGALTVILLALAWLALDDITTGRESRLGAEWAVVVAAAAWLSFLAWRRLRGGPPRRCAEEGRE